jgi:hypothetical protein
MNAIYIQQRRLSGQINHVSTNELILEEDKQEELLTSMM